MKAHYVPPDFLLTCHIDDCEKKAVLMDSKGRVFCDHCWENMRCQAKGCDAILSDPERKYCEACGGHKDKPLEINESPLLGGL